MNKKLDAMINSYLHYNNKGQIECLGGVYPTLDILCEWFRITKSYLAARLANNDNIDDILREAIKMDKRMIIHNGIIYNSFTDMCTKNNAAPSNVRDKLASGASLSEALRVTDRSTCKVEYKGKTYTSMAELCKSYNINASVVRSRLNKGMTLEQALETPSIVKPIKVTCFGKEFESMTALAKYYNIPKHILRTRLKSGMSPEDAVTTEVRHFKQTDYNGVRYRSLMEMCRKNNLSYEAVLNRLRNNYTLEEAIRDLSSKPKIIYMGVAYDSLVGACKAAGVSVHAVRYYIGRHNVKTQDIPEVIAMYVQKAKNEQKSK